MIKLLIGLILLYLVIGLGVSIYQSIQSDDKMDLNTIYNWLPEMFRKKAK